MCGEQIDDRYTRVYVYIEISRYDDDPTVVIIALVKYNT